MSEFGLGVLVGVLGTAAVGIVSMIIILYRYTKPPRPFW